MKSLERIYSEYRIFSSLDLPSKTEKREAAKGIAGDIYLLRTKLSSEAGGLRTYFDSALFQDSKRRNRKINFVDVTAALKVIEYACLRYINTYDEIKDKKTPQLVFAEELAILFINILNEKASKYCPPDLSIKTPIDTKGGKFARMLSVLLNSEQSLPNIAKAAVKNVENSVG
jgi:hypothetical protein